MAQLRVGAVANAEGRTCGRFAITSAAVLTATRAAMNGTVAAPARPRSSRQP